MFDISTFQFNRERDVPSGFSVTERERARPVVLAFGREEASGIAWLGYGTFKFTAASLPRDSDAGSDAFDAWLEQLSGRHVVIWPQPGPHGAAQAHAHAARIARLGAASVGVVSLAHLTGVSPADREVLANDDLRRRLCTLIRDGFDEAGALALPAHGTRPARAVAPWTAAPSPDEMGQGHVCGTTVLAQVTTFLKRHLQLSHDLHEVLALWCLHAWCARHGSKPLDLSPRLVLRGASMASDHGRALRAIAWLVPSPRVVTCATGRGLVDLAMQPKSTLLLDDLAGDMFARRDIASVVAAGARRDAGVVTGAVRTSTALQETCFAPVAIATSSVLPPGLSLHAIAVDIVDQPSSPSWSTTAFGDAPDEVPALRAALHACADRIAGDLRTAARRVAPLQSPLHDRNWQPLFAIAQVLGATGDTSMLDVANRGARTSLARDVALLAHLETLFRQGGATHLTTARIVEYLATKGHDIARGAGGLAPVRGLAEKLLHFGLRPVPIRLSNGVVARGYRAEALEDAFRSHLSMHKSDVASATQDANVTDVAAV